MEIRTFDKDTVIFRQGDVSRGMYDILSGSVGVYVAHGTENETQLTILKAGDFLGEMGMIEAYPRSATAVALEDGTQLREIGEKEFSDYFKDQPVRLLRIMQQLGQRLRDRTADYEAACKVLEGMKQTAPDKGKRSPSLLEQARKLIALYDSMMNSYSMSDAGSFFPDDRFLF